MFTERQITSLHALIDRIIPADDFPGGWDAGVGDYLFRQLQADLQLSLPMYRAGLDDLDAEAHAGAGVGFAELDFAAQDQLLQQIEQGVVQHTWHVEPVGFFRTVVAHTMEGFYSDPANGGNRDGIAWQMIGFEVRG